MKRMKCNLSILLILSIILCAVLMFTVSAASADDVDTVVVEGENLGNENEFQPVMANGCGNLTSWYNIDHQTKGYILSDATGNWRGIVGNNPNIYYNTEGYIVLCGTGSYSGKTYPTDLHRSWYI